MAYTSKDPRRRAAYRERQKIYNRRRRAKLKALNLLKRSPSVALRWSQYDPGYQTALLSYKEHVLLDLVDILRHVTVTIEPAAGADEGLHVVKLYRDIWAAPLSESLE